MKTCHLKLRRSVTLLCLAAFESVDVDEGEVIAFRVLELPATLGSLMPHVHAATRHCRTDQERERGRCRQRDVSMNNGRPMQPSNSQGASNTLAS